MPIEDEKVWVIKRGNYYVNPKYQSLYTGRATGFTFYSNEETMRKRLDELGEGYSCEYIGLNGIPDGERIYIN